MLWNEIRIECGMDLVLIAIGLQLKLNLNMNLDLIWIWNEIGIEYGLVWISIGV
jgi:hypothetical protein